MVDSKDKNESIPLKSFISDVLVNIAEGVSDANQRLKGRQHFSGNHAFEWSNSTKGSEKEKISKKGIEFDVVITAINSSSKNGGFSIAVPMLGEAGIGGNNELTQQQTSRIKFNIDIDQAVNSLKENT